MNVLKREHAKVDLFGRAVIPHGTEEIGFRAFFGNAGLKSVILPETVKTIATDAFCDCKNLQTVSLPEGLLSIGAGAFTGCSALKTLTLPDTVKDVSFWDLSGLTSPVYNASKTILYHYPRGLTGPVFALPNTVKTIAPSAFRENTALEEVVLPEGITVIPTHAFWSSSIERITIPQTIKVIKSRAFFCCKALKEVHIPGEDTRIEDGAFLRCPFDMALNLSKMPRLDQRLHWFGGSLLKRIRFDLPERDHTRDSRFLKLAAASAAGDASAMWKFADWFEALGEHSFYKDAANFWRYRAGQYGHPQANAWLEQWLSLHPKEHLPAILNESLSGPSDGKRLRYGGFLFFDPKREYSIEQADEDGVVLVSSWCGDDGPDESGFGREEYYDWWYLDEYLNPIPGTKYFHSYSRQDKEANSKDFEAMRVRAAERLNKRR